MCEHYTKPMDEPLIMYECMQLLDTLAENNIIHRDPDNPNNILVYMEADDLNPEGWYSQNLMSAAQDLLDDIEGQQLLRRELESRNIDMVFENILMKEDHLKNVTIVKGKRNDDYER